MPPHSRICLSVSVVQIASFGRAYYIYFIIILSPHFCFPLWEGLNEWDVWDEESFTLTRLIGLSDSRLLLWLIPAILKLAHGRANGDYSETCRWCCDARQRLCGLYIWDGWWYDAIFRPRKYQNTTRTLWVILMDFDYSFFIYIL